jgi:uncharacterized RDD family membrane protein YckC
MAEVVTGEAVVLEVPCARFPSRLLALGLDLLIQVALLVVLLTIVGVSAGSGTLNNASASALFITGMVLIMVGYPVTWETLTRGRSPGKFALGLRVVSDDGGPERFRQALVRGLAAIVEIYSFFGCPALLCSLLSPRGKRLGDLFAGTFVIQQRLPRRQANAPLIQVTPEIARWASGLEMSGLTDRTADTARQYLARMSELTAAAQAELGARIAAEVRAQVSPPPPPGVPPPAYLTAVLAERRNREHSRLMAAPADWQTLAPTPGSPPATPTPPYAPPAQPPAGGARPGQPPGTNTGGFAPPA